MIQQLHQTPTEDGNTESVSAKPSSSSARHWCFTIPSNQFETLELLQKLQTFCKSGCYQLEEGESTGYLHYQGYIELTKKNRREFLTKRLDAFHYEVCRNIDASIKYCTNPSKLRHGEPVLFNLSLPYSGQDLILEKDFYPWQKFISALVKTTPDDRSIYWFYEREGKTGKSKFAKTMAYHNPKVCMTTATKSADILTCVEKHYNTYIFDFPRSLGDFTPFNALEQLKNGYITDCKLKKAGRTLMFQPPHIIIFSNHEPNIEKLSKDRWKIYNIVDNDLTEVKLNELFISSNPNPNPNLWRAPRHPSGLPL